MNKNWCARNFDCSMKAYLGVCFVQKLLKKITKILDTQIYYFAKGFADILHSFKMVVI